LRSCSSAQTRQYPCDAGSDEELFVVTQGHAVFDLDGHRVDAPAGTVVHCPTGVQFDAIRGEPGFGQLIGA
jgi:mannose-6-phosphate isomerase-like protein (cupin superfamily)